MPPLEMPASLLRTGSAHAARRRAARDSRFRSGGGGDRGLGTGGRVAVIRALLARALVSTSRSPSRRWPRLHRTPDQGRVRILLVRHRRFSGRDGALAGGLRGQRRRRWRLRWRVRRKRGRSRPDAQPRRSPSLLAPRPFSGPTDLTLTSDDGTTPLMVASGLGRCAFNPNINRGARSPDAEARSSCASNSATTSIR